MSSVGLDDLRKSYGDTAVVRGITMDVPSGEFLVLVGPSGCGKSTTLRMIAGLEDITSGTLRIDDRVVNDVPPKDRDIGMVFQSYALYPHMTVRENVAFGLRLRKMPTAEIAARVDEVARILELGPLLDRKPGQLSGGQRQRVAMGRAIARQPKVFLFDEPLSNLDASLRVQMRTEIAALHRRLGTTMVYVTHDQVEAMTLATRIAVLHQGILQQVGPPLDLYQRPANRFVAGFIGSPAMNLLDGALASADGRPVLRTAEGLEVPVAPWELGGLSAGAALTFGIRPHDLRVGGTALQATVDAVERMGWEAFAHVHAGGQRLVVRAEGVDAVSLAPGQTLGLDVPLDHAVLFGPDGDALARRGA